MILVYILVGYCINHAQVVQLLLPPQLLVALLLLLQLLLLLLPRFILTDHLDVLFILWQYFQMLVSQEESEEEDDDMGFGLFD